jgi:hypothetical protein
MQNYLLLWSPPDWPVAGLCFQWLASFLASALTSIKALRFIISRVDRQFITTSVILPFNLRPRLRVPITYLLCMNLSFLLKVNCAFSDFAEKAYNIFHGHL